MRFAKFPGEAVSKPPASMTLRSPSFVEIVVVPLKWTTVGIAGSTGVRLVSVKL
jgi:hypothetical protein